MGGGGGEGFNLFENSLQTFLCLLSHSSFCLLVYMHVHEYEPLHFLTVIILILLRMKNVCSFYNSLTWFISFFLSFSSQAQILELRIPELVIVHLFYHIFHWVSFVFSVSYMFRTATVLMQHHRCITVLNKVHWLILQ